MKKEKYYLSEFDSSDDCVNQLLGTPQELLDAIEAKEICVREDHVYDLDTINLSHNILWCGKKGECISKIKQLNT